MNEEQLKAYKFAKKYFESNNTIIKVIRLNNMVRIVYNELNFSLSLCGNDYPLAFGIPDIKITTSLANKLIKELGISKVGQYNYLKKRWLRSE